jgi:hypothetical protein
VASAAGLARPTCFGTPSPSRGTTPGDPRLVASSVYHQHGRLYGTGAEPVQGLLERLSRRRQQQTRTAAASSMPQYQRRRYENSRARNDARRPNGQHFGLPRASRTGSLCTDATIATPVPIASASKTKIAAKCRSSSASATGKKLVQQLEGSWRFRAERRRRLPAFLCQIHRRNQQRAAVDPRTQPHS